MENPETAFIDTFETATFQFLNPMEQPLENYDDSLYSLGHCDFSGAVNGCFDLLLHESLIHDYLQFLFEDEHEQDVANTLKSDSIKELANVICGNLISKSVNAQADYTIDKPALKPLSSLKELDNQEEFTFFETAGKACGFRLYLK